MSENQLAKWNHFHDWYLDQITIGPNEEPRTITLGLYLGSERANVVFKGVTCFCLENLGLLNIVYSIRMVEPNDKNYEYMNAVLSKGERLSKCKGERTVFMYSSLGAELAVEFESLEVEPESPSLKANS